MKCSIDQKSNIDKIKYANNIKMCFNIIYKYINLSIPFIVSLLVIITQFILLYSNNKSNITGGKMLVFVSLPFLILWLLIVLDDIRSNYDVYVRDIICPPAYSSSTMCKSICSLNIYFICTLLWIVLCIITNISILVY